MKKSAVYVHLPFCERKCLYCSFAVAVGQEHRIDEYLDALAGEMAGAGREEVSSLYIGGGTPTLLSPAQWERFWRSLTGRFRWTADAEITVEANPENIDADRAAALRSLGVNRVSLGVQSLNDHYLSFLGRCHDSRRAIASFELLRRAGFTNISLDLMYAFPGQTERELADDVARIASLGSEHLSLYTLTIEENSRFYAQRLAGKDSREQSDLYQKVVEWLGQRGFPQYEVSNFARPGSESRHNIGYWTGENYWGFGMSAHSHRDGRRYWNVPRLTSYLAAVREGRSPAEGEERLGSSERLMETFLLGLRMRRGVDIGELAQRFGCGLGMERENILEGLVREGLLERAGRVVRPTVRGLTVLDEMSSRLI